MFNFSSHLLSRLFVFTFASLLTTMLLLTLSSGQTRAVAQVPAKVSNDVGKVMLPKEQTKDFSRLVLISADKNGPKFSLESNVSDYGVVTVNKDKDTFVISNDESISFKITDASQINWRDVQASVFKVQHEENTPSIKPTESMASVECGWPKIINGDVSCKLTLEPGLYKLTDIVITAQDSVGNVGRTTLSKLMSSKVKNILVDDVSLGISVTTEKEIDGAGITHVHEQPALEFTFENDKWFSYRSLWLKEDGSEIVTITNKDGSIGFSFDDLKFPGSKSQVHTYTSTYSIPSLNDKTGKETKEGRYDIVFRDGVTDKQDKLVLDFYPSASSANYEVALAGDVDTLTYGAGESQEKLMVSSGGLTFDFSDLKGVREVVAYKHDPDSKKDVEVARVGVDCRSRKASLELNGDVRIDSFVFEAWFGKKTVIPVSSLASGDSTFDDVKEIIVDKTKPEVSTRVYRGNTPDPAFVTTDGRNYYSGNDTLTMKIEITESNFDLLSKWKKQDIASFSVDGEEKKKLTTADFTRTGDVWVASVELDSGDAEYKLEVREFNDISTRKSDPFEKSVTIDTVAPQLSISFDNDSSSQGQYYNAPRIATIHLVEKNPNQDKALVAITAKNSAGEPISVPSLSEWKTVAGRDDTYEARVPFSADGHYAVTVSATDEAGHESADFDVAEFVIDTTEPELICTGNLENGRAYGNDVSQTCKITDAHLDSLLSSYKLEGARNGQAVTSQVVSEESSGENQKSFSFTFPKELAYDDVYELTLDAVDMAGNSHVEKWNFSINRFGSTFSFSDEAEKMRGTYVQKASDIEIHEVNVSGVPLNSLNINVGRNSDDSRRLQTYDYEAKTLDERGWHRNVYTLPSSLFKQDGAYTIVVESTDLAGNFSRNTRNNSNAQRNNSASYEFIVDGTKPVAELIGIQSGSSYRQTSLTVDANISDVNILYAELKIDGKKVTEWDEEQLKGSNPSYVIPADSEEHTIELVAVDKAMNKTTATYTDVLVTKDYASPVLEDSRKSGFVVAASIIVGVLVSGIGIALYWRGYRRETKAAIFNA